MSGQVSPHYLEANGHCNSTMPELVFGYARLFAGQSIVFRPPGMRIKLKLVSLIVSQDNNHPKNNLVMIKGVLESGSNEPSYMNRRRRITREGIALHALEQALHPDRQRSGSRRDWKRHQRRTRRPPEVGGALVVTRPRRIPPWSAGRGRASLLRAKLGGAHRWLRG